MNKLRKDKMKDIPDGIYCEGCPFHSYKKTNYFFGFGHHIGRKKESLEYCNYIKRYLSVQDFVKDCNIRYNRGEMYE